MEEHTILDERIENQLKALEWIRAEQKRLLKEKGERLSKELMEGMTPFIMNQKKVYSTRIAEMRNYYGYSRTYP